VRQQPVRTELIEVPVDRYIALPAALTAPLLPPAPPPRNCTLRGGTPTVCALEAVLWSTQWKALLDRANEDRATASRLGREAAEAGRSDRDGEVKP
jgi:hypothetical protein